MQLDYASTLSPELIFELERAAHWVGLPLRELELLGQDPKRAQAFVESVDRDDHEAFLDDLDWRALEQKLYQARSPAGIQTAWPTEALGASS